MAMKYEDADQATIEIFERARESVSDLGEAKIKYVFRDKRKGNDDNITFADIRKFSDLVKHITMEIPDYSDEGLHYCVVIDKNIWEALDEKDKFRIARHEFLHAKVKFKEDGTTEYNLRDHTVRTFYEEIEIENKDGGDPRWMERLANIAVSIYDEIKEKEKAAKGGKKGRKKRG